jgi:hypothetical protein
MTIQVQTTKITAPITVHHHTHEGVEGYIFRVSGDPVFISEHEADKLARYMLFKDGEPNPPLEDTHQ